MASGNHLIDLMYILTELISGMTGHGDITIIVGIIIMHGTGVGIPGTIIDGVIIAGIILTTGMKAIGLEIIGE